MREQAMAMGEGLQRAVRAARDTWKPVSHVAHVLEVNQDGPTDNTSCGIPISRYIRWGYQSVTLAEHRIYDKKARWCKRCNRCGTLRDD
jgi:hypothetical protein